MMKFRLRSTVALPLALLVALSGASTAVAGSAAQTQDEAVAPDSDQQSVAGSGGLVSEGQAAEIQAQLTDLIAADGPEPLLDAATISAIAASPAGASLTDLVTAYLEDPAVPAALNAVVAGLQDLPPGYSGGNPWKAASSGRELPQLMVDDFLGWVVFLPRIDGDKDDGLDYIERIAWFNYLNQAGEDSVQGRDPLIGGSLEVGPKFLTDFSTQRGEWMWSPASTALIEQWVSDPHIEIEDYQRTEASEFSSFDDFFARHITIDEATQTIPSRPVTTLLSEYPERDYIVVSPTDCIMNALVQVLAIDAEPVRRLVEKPLQYDTVLDVKGIPISLERLLGNLDDDIKQEFVGGTGLSCVLMPNLYHHFHSPVNGTIVHAEVLEAVGTYGVFDFANWVPLNGNVGRSGADFSQFEVFERGVVVIEVAHQDVDGSELTGYVASVPVGLNNIGSVVLDEAIVEGAEVKRGYTRLGNSYCGGSLDILLFSKDLAAGALQTRLGTQIAVFDIGDLSAVE